MEESLEINSGLNMIMPNKALSPEPNKLNLKKLFYFFLVFLAFAAILQLITSTCTTSRVTGLFISEDDKYLLITNEDGRAKLFDLKDDSLVTHIGPLGRVWRPPTLEKGVKGLKPVKGGFIDDNKIILNHYGYGIKCYDMDTKEVVWQIDKSAERIIKVPNKHLFVIRPGTRPYIEIVSTTDGQLVQKIDINSDFIWIEYITDNHVIISNSDIGKIFIVDINMGKATETIRLGGELIFNAPYFDLEKFCSLVEGAINFYNLHTGEIIKKMKYILPKEFASNYREHLKAIKFVDAKRFLVAYKNKYILFNYEAEEAIKEYIPPKEESIGNCLNSLDCQVVFNNSGTAYYLINDKMEYKKISLEPFLNQSSHQ
jgi:WD40 repeat protein